MKSLSEMNLNLKSDFVESVRQLMQGAVADGIFPGGVLLVAKEGKVLFLEAFGFARLDPERPATTDTIFDLASLTKPLATTPALMLMIQEGLIDLDQAVSAVLSDFEGTDKESITIRQLLSHTSGLPDYKPFYEELSKHPLSERVDLLRASLVREKLISQPGEASLYSDLDFMVLQWLVEVVTGKPLNHLVEESVYRPLGLDNLFFIPIDSSSGKRDQVFAATEDCPWRAKVLEGEVHDDNACVLGGVAGHAGLFGTAEDVYRLLQELLNVYSGKRNEGLFRQDVVQTFFRRQSDSESWALGFDMPSRPDSSSGKYFSDQSVGHLGFAGTSFWMDLEKEVIVVLLTNRVHLSRENEKIKTFRPVLHDEVMKTILRKER